jgi:flagellar motility protein MotE (MotC chaperone)
MPRPELMLSLLAPLLMAAAPEASTQDLPLWEALKARAATIDAEKAEIEQSRTDLKTAEAALDAKIATLKGLIERQEVLKSEVIAERKKLEETKDKILDDRVIYLGKVTEKMPPAKAASYLAGLEEGTAASILKTLGVDKAAKIVANLAPSKAAAISRLYLKHDPTSSAQPGPRHD